MIYTNRCKHCGKTKEEHYTPPPPNNTATYCTDGNENFDQFYDSGKANFDAALDAHKEELWGACNRIYLMSKDDLNADDPEYSNWGDRFESLHQELYKILNQIEKEK